MRRKLAAGNWKMNGLSANLAEIEMICSTLPTPKVDIVIAPPTTILSSAVVTAANHSLDIAGQDCHPSESGAHTGDISADMLRDAGASYVIVGHSERRDDHEESDTDVRSKARTAVQSGLCAIVCIGESLEEREADNTLAIIAGQLAGSLPDDVTEDTLVIAYEPIWAIGTGKVPTLEQIAEVHDFIRATISKRYGDEIGSMIRILYGGSVKPSNAADIFGVSNVDGALVGGASLKADDFVPIISALESSI